MGKVFLQMIRLITLVWMWVSIAATQLLGLAFYPTVFAGYALPLAPLIAGLTSTALIVVARRYCVWEPLWWLTRAMPLIVTALILLSLEGPQHSLPLANNTNTVYMLALLVGVPLLLGGLTRERV